MSSPHSRRMLLATLGALPGLGFQRTGRAQPATLPTRIVGAFDTLFAGPHEGRRAVHGNGLLVSGGFTPAPDAANWWRAPHLRGGEVPVLVRFSCFAAVPGLPENDPAASPRGMAVRFLLPDAEADIVAHSFNGFPAATPEEFLGFLGALASGPAGLEAFATAHPAARNFLDTPKPAPVSYATEEFFGVSALRFIGADGVRRAGRYRLVPAAGKAHLDAAAAALEAPDFLSRELPPRMARGEADFRLLLQLAGPGDRTDDGTRPWPEDRPLVELGRLRLRDMVPDGEARQRQLLFTPLNLVDGIEPGDDPMLLARTRAYRVSAERRLAPEAR
ncbi:catalase family peroxidase [Roseomonas sp. BN140053]|uniref:catalase family peroxidase n=1 Tax=Roseomonas sp. BN140053 TaxID=3391898 RepID=UPI0039E7B09C